jgi:uncharacterized RDD family membrane protein YckC
MNRLASVLLIASAVWHAPMLHAQDNGVPDKAVPVVATNNVNAETATQTSPGDASPSIRENRSGRTEHGPTVSFWSDAILKQGEVGEAVVAIGGSARALGTVQNAVVAIGGDAEAEEEVGAAVVAVGGNATARGDVGAAMVAVGGNAEARAGVRDAVVAIMGNVRIGSNAVVRGDVISVGGTVEREPGAEVRGNVSEVGIGPLLIPLKGATDWLKHCALKFRLLAPQLGWYWVIPGLYLLGYLLITVAFPRPVAACVAELTRRPATTFLLGLLTELLVPLIVGVLAITGIGAIAVPFIYAALFIGGLVGKTALFQFLGRQMVRVFGVQLSQPVLAMLCGFTLILLLYMVPFLSLLAYMLVALWGIGIAVTASFGSMRKESPPRPNPSTSTFPPAAAAPPTSVAGAGSVAFAGEFPPGVALETAAPPMGSGPEAPIPPRPMPVPPTASVAGEALTLPRASFWERMGAAFLDVILVSILGHIVGGAPLGYLVALAYFAGMWTWKGTTVGGVVLNLKVVRLDDKPVTFLVALVRGLASAFSVVVLCLGFFWMIWDREKQTWHDKIAGTVVVRQPRAVPLFLL